MHYLSETSEIYCRNINYSNNFISKHKNKKQNKLQNLLDKIGNLNLWTFNINKIESVIMIVYQIYD